MLPPNSEAADLDEHRLPENFSLESGPVLLYDGECGVCSSAVQWILRHERSPTLRFSALTSQVGTYLRTQAGLSQEIDSLLWVEVRQGHLVAYKWSDSLVAVLKYVGGPWKLAALIRWIPSFLRDRAYRLFAKHRLQIAPRACLIPAPEDRARFLS